MIEPDAVGPWRRELRARMIARREALDDAQRRRVQEAITALLIEGFPELGRLCIGFTWPYRGEFDARHAMRAFRERGALTALPVVTGRGRPLEFRAWRPGVAMRKEVFGIPVPEGTPAVAPAVVLPPLVAFDALGYRLGYGGGYFDRTLAAASPRPLSIGVGCAALRVETLHPQPYDLPMDFIVTEEGIFVGGGAPLTAIAAAECAARFRELLARRGLITDGGAGFASPPCYAKDFPGWFGAADDAE